jgi:dUTP pyrophosphatase
MSNYYLLKIYIEDETLREVYQEHMSKHKDKISEQRRYGDAGFDLIVPDEITTVSNGEPIKIDMKICIAMFRTNSIELEYPCAYYLYPRSSLYKTGLRLTNSVGIIDSGYRGHLAGFFDVVKSSTIPKYSRLLQICSPDLTPIYAIQMVDTLEELGVTSRGAGGFGSTGF